MWGFGLENPPKVKKTTHIYIKKKHLDKQKKQKKHLGQKSYLGQEKTT